MITSTLRLRMLAQTVLAGFIFVGSICFAVAPSPSPTPAGATDEKLLKGMQWRQIDPFRGGRALTIEGVPGEADAYYFGSVAGGVWGMHGGGANWTPLFDKEPLSSIG